jgi:GntR family transcriptional regulator/MocR family aminotransferase
MTALGSYVPALVDRENQPLFVQIARAISADIRRGRLPARARLPGSRELARSLGAHRNTVLAAYAELEQEGWIVTERARGTFVAQVLPEVRPRRLPARRAESAPQLAPAALDLDLPVFDFAVRRELPAGVLQLLGGAPDRRLVPHDALARAYRRALKRDPRTLDYGPARGHPRLVSALRELLREARGVIASGEELVVTRGSQMALFLATRALCRPGDVIAVEALGYPPAWDALRLGGARLVSVPLDRGGMRLDALARVLEKTRLRAVYVTPHHQYPTTVTMTAARRLELMSLAERHGFLILEDDYDHEFHWQGRPVLPLASADPLRRVLYIGTLSKVLAPGLRLGYLVARSDILDSVLKLREVIDRQGDHVVERAVAELIEDGELDRHAKRTRRAYLERREALAEALQNELGAALSFEVPVGGLAFWARARVPMGVERLAERALAEGVAVQHARPFAFDGRGREFLRIGFPAHTPAELRRAVRVLAGILKS